MTAGDRFENCSRFVIVTQPRSGSYHLTSLLDSAGDVTCLGEILKPDKVELPEALALKTGYALTDVEKRDADFPAYLERLISECGSSIFGFKEFVSRITRARLGPQTLRSRSWRKIFLTRNALRIYVSTQRANETGRYTKRAPGAARHDNRIIRFDPELFDPLWRATRGFAAGSGSCGPVSRGGSGRSIIANWRSRKKLQDFWPLSARSTARQNWKAAITDRTPFRWKRASRISMRFGAI